jgi:hypothetical protein
LSRCGFSAALWAACLGLPLGLDQSSRLCNHLVMAAHPGAAAVDERLEGNRHAG